jgi:hypothetical protein
MSIILDWLVPSRRHREEERNRLEWSRDQEGLGDPHHGPIDLDSGVVKIKAADAGDVSGPVDAPANDPEAP